MFLVFTANTMKYVDTFNAEKSFLRFMPRLPVSFQSSSYHRRIKLTCCVVYGKFRGCQRNKC